MQFDFVNSMNVSTESTPLHPPVHEFASDLVPNKIRNTMIILSSVINNTIYDNIKVDSSNWSSSRAVDILASLLIEVELRNGHEGR
jgi:hypothetical protein